VDYDLCSSCFGQRANIHLHDSWVEMGSTESTTAPQPCQTESPKDFEGGHDRNPDMIAPTAMVYSKSLRRWVDAVISEELTDDQNLDDPQVMVQYQDPGTGVCRKRMSIHSDNLDVTGKGGLLTGKGGLLTRREGYSQAMGGQLPATDDNHSDNAYSQTLNGESAGELWFLRGLQRCRQLQEEPLSQGSEASEIEECDPGGVSLPDPAYLLRAPPPSQQEMHRQAQQNYLQRPHWDVQGRQRQIEASRADGAVAGGRAGLGVERRNFGGEREEELRRQRRQMRSFG